MPTHAAEYDVTPGVQVAGGTVQLPLTELNVVPVASYPDQLGLALSDPTVSVAALVDAEPELFVKTARNSQPFSACVASFNV
jgi:hypothetical protein